MLTLTQIGFVFLVLAIHYIADFILQDEAWAQNKSKCFKALTTHTYVYALTWAVVGMLYVLGMMMFGGLAGAALTLMIMKVIKFAVITFVCHTVTDYYTSPVVKNYFLQHVYGSRIPNWGAFSMIGLDQILHYVQLFLTFYLLGV